MKRVALVRRSPLRARSELRRTAAARRVTARLAESRRVYADACTVVDARSGGVCEVCQNRPATEHQHRIRRGNGSSRNHAVHRVSNLIHCCKTCHLDADGHPDRYCFGWQVRRTQDPAVVPVLYRGEWVLLDDQGGWTPAVGPDLGGAA